MGDRLSAERSTLIATVLSFICTVAILAGCDPSEPEVGAVEALRARHESASRIAAYLDLTELIGNTKFQVGSQAPAALTVAVVRGRVTDVTEGRAFTVEGNDAPSGTLTDFDDSRALWRTFHATFDVAEVISGTANAPVTVGLAVGPKVTVDTVRRDLVAMKEVVVFLERSPVFEYDNTILGVVSDGASSPKSTQRATSPSPSWTPTSRPRHSRALPVWTNSERLLGDLKSSSALMRPAPNV